MNRSFLFKIILLALAIPCLSVLGFGQQPASTDIIGIQQGTRFSDINIPFRGRVSEAHIFSDGNHICAVEMQYSLSDNRVRTSSRHGGSCGQQSSFHINPNEYIVGILGRYDTHIDSMQIRTNRRTSPLFGGSGGAQEYRIDVDPGNQAVGFTGRSGRYLNAIGLNYVPLTMSLAGHTIVAGGSGGNEFSDPEVPRGAKIAEVRVRSGDMINALQVVYALVDGRSLEGQVHGGEGGTLSAFKLDPNEYIIGFSGKSGVHINSISIRTNKRTSQAFGGNKGGSIFAINVPAGNQVIGIRGRSDSYVDAIGLNYVSVNRSPRGRD